MTIKCELSADRERGAGHGLLRVTGLADGSSGPIDFLLMRNQGTAPYLGRGGIWQATEAWHAATEVSQESGTLVFALTPEFIDPIVAQPTTVAYRLSIAAGASKEAGTLKVHRPLLGSAAAAPEAPPPEPAPPPPPPLPDEPPAIVEALPPPVVVEPEQRSRLPLIAALLALLAIGAGGFAAWYGCLIEGFGAPRCTAPATAAQPAAEQSPQQPPAQPPADTGSSAPPPPAEEALNCAGLDAAGCIARAQSALAQKQLEPARQMFQQAAELGAVEANIALARMYDPANWSKDASPVAEANWETAVYWYEKAARQGNADAQLAAGRLLCEKALTEFERNQGVTYLRQAVQAGDASAKPLLHACEAKTK